MPIDTIQSVVYSRVPWLVTPTDDSKVDTFICQLQFTLQPYFGFTDAEAEDESNYSNRQKLLTGLYTAYELVCEKAMENTGGKDGAKPEGNKVLKKAKADVVEAEFTIPKSEDGATLTASAKQISMKLRDEICNLAKTMKISLPLCSYRNTVETPADAGALPFRRSCNLTNCC